MTNTEYGFLSLIYLHLVLKVPKCEIFAVTLFSISEPIWVCDLGTEPKNEFFRHLTPDFDGFLPYPECAVNKKKFKVVQN
jgi:hypothetical protein